MTTTDHRRPTAAARANQPCAGCGEPTAFAVKVGAAHICHACYTRLSLRAAQIGQARQTKPVSREAAQCFRNDHRRTQR